MKPLTNKDVVFTIHADYEDIPVRGNAIASDDPAFDKQVEEEILDRLDNGDVWAWASVEVRGTYKGLKSSTYLGCCSYENEEAFRNDGYYEDMCAEVLADLNQKVSEIIEDRI